MHAVKNSRPVSGTMDFSGKEIPAGPFAQHLQHTIGKSANFILYPQPSKDPNDPLNWPQWQKDIQLAILSLGTAIFASTFVYFIPFQFLLLLVPGTVVISTELDVSISAVVQLGGYQLLV